MSTQFEIRRGDQHLGTFTANDIRAMAASGDLKPSDEIRKAGTERWAPAEATKDLEFPTVPLAESDSPTPVSLPAPTGDIKTGLMGVAIYANLVALLVNLLRDLLGHGKILRSTANAQTLAHGLLVIVSVLFILGSLWLSIKTDSISILLIGVGGFIAMGVGQYAADKFIAAGSRLLQSTPTSINNTVLLDVIGLVAVLVGLVSLGGGAVTSIQTESLPPIAVGFFTLLICLIFGSMAFCPEALNITPAKDTSAGEEAIGLASFFIKALLFLAPFLYLAGAFVSGIMILTGFYALTGGDRAMFDAMSQISTAGGIMISFSFYPLILYIIFLVYYLLIDVIRAILNIDSNVEDMHKSDG